MKKRPRSKPLHGGQKRQAVGALRGYLYQIWHTAHAWLELKDDELLFLECAEDFDIVNAERAAAVQVKASKRAITLNSPDVIEAIKHYWALIQTNSDRTIHFRFLTQGAPGVEKGNPFGKGVKGLDLWKRCAREAHLVEGLRTWLRALRGLPPDLTEFLATADANSVLEKVILKITWETHCSDLGDVEEAIKNRIVGRLDRETLPPSRADRIVNRLLKETLTTACRPEGRHLSRARFLEVWEEETTERIPIAQLQKLMGSAGMMSIAISDLTGGGPGVSFELSRMAEPVAPPLLGDLAPRGSLVANVVLEVERRSVAILTGSAGMGKTTLANIVVHSGEQRWLWFRLSSRTPLEVAALLRRITAGLGDDRSAARIVLDDLDLQPGSASAYEEVLGGLAYTLRTRNGQMLITSQRPAPGRLLRRLALGQGSTLHIPPLSEAEVTTFAAQLGCPKETALIWGRVVGLQTRGHPQLVHARLRHLAEAGWPSFRIEEVFTTPPDVLREQADARQVLLNQLSEDQRTLVYRLSVFGGPFRRDHAIGIGGEEPCISLPGEVLEHLLGPWIETLPGGYYRLSALLDKAADQVWSSETINSLHVAAARAILRSKPLTTVEARGVLLHALLARSPEFFGIIAAGILNASGKVWKTLSEDLSWLTLIAPASSQRVFPEDSFANYMLRMVQFKIAAEQEPLKAAQIAELWDKETILRGSEERFAMERFMLATKVLVNYRVDIPARRALSLLMEIAQRREQLERLGKPLRCPPPPAGLRTRGIADPFGDLFMFVIARCSGPAFLEDVVGALTELLPESRQQILAGLKHTEINARLLIDRVWLQEAGREQPDWRACIDAFKKAMAQAQAWNSPELLAAAARGMAVVYEEYLSNAAEAIAVVDRATRLLGHPVRILEDERATILLHQQRYSEALATWERLLPQWHAPKEDFDLQPVFACRGAAIAAAHARKWRRAAELFVDGGRRAGEAGQSGMAAAFKCDAGFALWKANARKEATKTWMETLELLGNLSAATQEPRIRGVGRVIGHTLLWVARAAGGNSVRELAVPTPGFNSDIDRAERAAEMSTTSLEIAWLNLVEIEYHLRTGVEVFAEAKRRFCEEPLPVVSSFLAEYDIKHALRRLQVENCVEMAAGFVTALRISAAHRTQGRGITERRGTVAPPAGSGPDVDLVVSVLLAALVALVSSGKAVGSDLNTWKRKAHKVDGGDSLISWIERAEGILSGSLGTAVANMKARESTQEVRLLSALRVAADPEVMPGDLFHAHMILLMILDMGPWLEAVADGFSMLITRQWTKAVQTQAILRAPRLTVPSIREACAMTTAGIRKSAKILLEASAAVNVRLPNEMLARLKELAAGGAEL